MKNYEKSIIPIIESNYDNLTSIEKIIADFFIKHNKIEHLEAKEVAKQLYISEASISRFAKKIGFSGYREFIYQYRESFQTADFYTEEGTTNVLHTYQEILNKSYNLIDEKQIERITQQISHKKRIYVYGVGSSGLVANEFKARFMRIGLDVEAITDFHLLLMNSVRLNKDSLVIGISIGGSTKEIIDALYMAKGKSATTIFITSRNNHRFTIDFDEVVLTAVRHNLEYGNVISPQFPALIIIDILYASCLKDDRRNKEARYDATIETIIGRYV